MDSQRILLVEDDEDIRDLLKYSLNREGYQVMAAANGGEGIRLFEATIPVLVLLDLMLPDMNGIELCRAIRKAQGGTNTLILMLTARDQESEIVQGLDAGADDYVTKPFRIREVAARVRALLRRRFSSPEDDEEMTVIADLVIRPLRHEVTAAGTPVRLTATEFRILACLARRPGWVFQRYQIVDDVRGDGHSVTDRSVDVQIVSLRKKLGVCGSYIETVRGMGYRLRQS